MRWLVKGARVISPADQINGEMDLLIQDEHIAGVGTNLDAGDGQVINAHGLTLFPGFVDLHTHIGEPGHEERETINTGTAAAARGGYTTLLQMPDTDPPLDTAPAVAQAINSAKHSQVHVLVAGALTRNLAGQEMAELAAMVEAGATALVQPDGSVTDAGLFRRILQYAKGLTPFIAEQPHDTSLMADGLMHEGRMSTLYGMKGIPASAEEVAVARDLLLAAETGSRLHLSRISTAGSVHQIAAAKATNIPVSCDVSPYHLVFTDEALDTYHPNFKLNPPLRAASDVEALRKALADGTIDCIASDHTPLTPEEKDVEFNRAPWGAVALEMTFALLYTNLVYPGLLSLDKLVDTLSCKPAQLLGLNGIAGTVQPGSPADFVLVDLETERRVTAETMHSRGKNTPALGALLRGWPVATYVSGKQVWGSQNQ